MNKEEEQKRKKKKRQSLIPIEKQVESQQFLELLKTLEELEKGKKYADIQICPECKSPRVRRVRTMSGDLWSNMGILPPKFECQECGWASRLVLKATNRPMGLKDVSVVAEAKDLPVNRKAKSK